MCDHFLIENPKRRPTVAAGRDEWFPYYAGFSSLFARKIIQSSELGPESVALDPWNGSGTSTSAAVISGYRAIGFDLNPVMAVVAKARLLANVETPSIAPLLSEILRKTAHQAAWVDEDPLLTWFTPSAAGEIRSIERALHLLLVSANRAQNPAQAASRMSSIACFFYVALFRSVRQLLKKFKASNPTWVTRPASPHSRVRPNPAEIRSAFKSQVRAMAASIAAESTGFHSAKADCSIGVASSESLPIPSDSVDLVLSSPPYCTRIDYGVATSPELAVLGLELGNQLRELRGKLIGSPTIQETPLAPSPIWGASCNAFLDQVVQHPSKGAKSYYYKTYAQYFAAIARSISEIGRCVKSGGNCVIVIQDSHFKGIRADLATMFTEIASTRRLTLSRRVDFPMSRTLAHINTKSRIYRASSASVESVLCFTKN